MLNMITGINDLKTSTKQISCECKCKVNGRKCISNQKWNNDKCQCEYRNLKKNIMGVIKIIFGILPHVLVKTVNI